MLPVLFAHIYIYIFYNPTSFKKVFWKISVIYLLNVIWLTELDLYMNRLVFSAFVSTAKLNANRTALSRGNYYKWTSEKKSSRVPISCRLAVSQWTTIKEFWDPTPGNPLVVRTPTLLYASLPVGTLQLVGDNLELGSKSQKRY